jgi:peptidoglycan hydrolase CwlO-like protein
LTLDVQESTAEVTEKQDDLAKTEEQIQDSNEFIEERKADLFQYQADLETENEAF